MSYLNSITRFSSADNLGGILSIQVARAADIENIPDPVDGIVYGDIDFFPGKGFVSWDCTSESGSAESKSRQSREGSTKGNTLPFVIPKGRASLQNMFDQAEEDEFVVLFKDANGKQRIFGTKETPVRFRYDHTSGEAHSDLNRYSCEFYYTGPGNMFDYNGAIASPPAGAAPAVVRFNGTAIAVLQPGEELDIISDFGFTDFYVSTP